MARCWRRIGAFNVEAAFAWDAVAPDNIWFRRRGVTMGIQLLAFPPVQIRIANIK